LGLGKGVHLWKPLLAVRRRLWLGLVVMLMDGERGWWLHLCTTIIVAGGNVQLSVKDYVMPSKSAEADTGQVHPR
jgi:hypothetical protein